MTATGRGRGGQVSLVGLAWFPRAACANLTPAEADRLFFDQRWSRAGRTICQGCPVQAECLQYALDQGEADGAGLYGGLTLGERDRIRRRLVSRQTAQAAHAAARTLGVTAVAERLGVSRMTLYRAWDQYGLGAPIRQPAEACEAAS